MNEARKRVRRPDIESFKRMCRLLELKRRSFLERDWQQRYSRMLPRSRFNHLMLVRFVMPCNLGTIMAVTGLTSAGASLFVDKLVQQGILQREDDPADRRNVRISLSAKGQEFLSGVDDRLNDYIAEYFDTTTGPELEAIDRAMRILCDKLEARKDTIPTA